ncbi:nuclear transport factor 2 family protein [Streptomyces sp. NPDC020141]|uniref:nuclear transport factor 2 family protein n=1 Tax=Streptomyces sp. NPDC020141 TaxID=3365065 RepID=UPI0037B50C85
MSERTGMSVDLGTTPEAFVSNFFNSYGKEVVFGSENPGQDVDRYYTPDFTQIADGAEMTRQQLVDHIPAARQTFEKMHYDVQEALLSGTTLATRFTFHGTLKSGGAIEVEFYLFAEVTEDRRLSRIHQVTRTLKNDMAAG